MTVKRELTVTANSNSTASILYIAKTKRDGLNGFENNFELPICSLKELITDQE